jgi:hypothetical protein
LSLGVQRKITHSAAKILDFVNKISRGEAPNFELCASRAQNAPAKAFGAPALALTPGNFQARKFLAGRILGIPLIVLQYL